MYLYFCCINILTTCLSVHHMCVLSLWRIKEDIRSSRTVISDNCEPLHAWTWTWVLCRASSALNYWAVFSSPLYSAFNVSLSTPYEVTTFINIIIKIMVKRNLLHMSKVTLLNIKGHTTITANHFLICSELDPCNAFKVYEVMTILLFSNIWQTVGLEW